MPKPPTEPSNASVTVAATSSQNEVSPTPETPVTQVTIEALTSLHDLIKQDACAPSSDKASRRRLQMRVQKLASAAKISFAKEALLQDHNQLLYRINNKAKVRRSTRSLVIGRAKVMSYEDLDIARAARTAKEKTAAEKGKGKRGRKHKVPAREAEGDVEDEVEDGAHALEVGSSVCPSKDKRAKQTSVQEPEPWRAPVALMYKGVT
ncbi:hypothetical protein EK21DRAFT_119410 [Setomelanomma holmii]|uniref:Uncharacterized protein n=1 Tax=Setomelanomma holmii TaxID=210430 RepID=A0A9P4GVI1_9PLEO|nr:hypothetical protein EK21DRAFT_119410 [Setomelanomma holmii]